MNEGGLAIWMTWSRALVVDEEKIEELKNRRIDNLKNWDLNLGFECRCWEEVAKLDSSVRRRKKEKREYTWNRTPFILFFIFF